MEQQGKQLRLCEAYGEQAYHDSQNCRTKLSSSFEVRTKSSFISISYTSIKVVFLLTSSVYYLFFRSEWRCTCDVEELMQLQNLQVADWDAYLVQVVVIWDVISSM